MSSNRLPGHSFLHEGNAGEAQQAIARQVFGPRAAQPMPGQLPELLAVQVFERRYALVPRLKAGANTTITRRADEFEIITNGPLESQTFARRDSVPEILVSLLKLFIGSNKLAFRDLASYFNSPNASSLDIESPNFRLNNANQKDVILGAGGFNVYPNVHDSTDHGTAANWYKTGRHRRMLGGMAHLIDENVSIKTETGYYIPRYLEIASGFTLTIEADADLEIG